jgi:sugar phosphate isomerase/epimerase
LDLSSRVAPELAQDLAAASPEDRWYLLITIDGDAHEAADHARELGAEVLRVHEGTPAIGISADTRTIGRLASADWVEWIEGDDPIGPV